MRFCGSAMWTRCTMKLSRAGRSCSCRRRIRPGERARRAFAIRMGTCLCSPQSHSVTVGVLLAFPCAGGATMPRQEILDRIQKYVQPYRISDGRDFKLRKFDPSDTCGLKLDKGEASELLQQGTQWLAQEQD